MYYVDTSLVVARYKPNDPLKEAAEKFFSDSKGARFVSPLTLMELYSVYSRILAYVRFPTALPKLSEEERVEALVQASLIDCGLSAVTVTFSAEWVLGKRILSVPLEYAEARRLAPRLRLRTLDLLHISYSSLLRKIGIPISEFITGDKNLSVRSKEIENLVGIRVRTPP